MSNYFRNFRKVPYKFGDETSSTRFQKLSQYVDLLDQFADDAAAYTEVEIRDGDRPDTLAHRLYQRSDYDFTFFLINDQLRETGWPMTSNQLTTRAQTDLFQHYTAKLDVEGADSAALFSSIYPVGTSVLVSGKEGTVVRKNLDVGEIVISSDNNLTGGTTLEYKTPVSGNALTSGASLTNTVYEYEGTHHYENDSDEWLDKYFDDLSGATLKTNLDFLIDENDKSKRIRVLKKDLVGQLVGELKRLLANNG